MEDATAVRAVPFFLSAFAGENYIKLRRRKCLRKNLKEVNHT